MRYKQYACLSHYKIVATFDNFIIVYLSNLRIPLCNILISFVIYANGKILNFT